MRLAGKKIYVTGGSSGIGKAIVNYAYARGADVILIARNEEKLNTAKKELMREAKSQCGRIFLLPLDVCDERETLEILPRKIAEWGTPDIVVNSAGAAHPGDFETLSHSVLKSLWEVNVGGVWNVTQAVVPSMKGRRSGVIVNVSSVAGIIGFYGYTAYSATKYAVIGFSEALRNELIPHGVRVCILCPPDTETPQYEKEREMLPLETVQIAKMGKLLSPDTVAKALFKGLGRNSFLITPGFIGTATLWGTRLIPGVVRRVLDHDVATVRRRRVKEAKGQH